MGFGGRGTAGEEGHSLRSRNEETRARDVAFAYLSEFFKSGEGVFLQRKRLEIASVFRLGWGFRAQESRTRAFSRSCGIQAGPGSCCISISIS